MRTLKIFLPLAFLLLAQPALHGAVRTRTTFHQRAGMVRQSPIAFHPAASFRQRDLLVHSSALPETVNAPARATVFSYLVNLIRGIFSRAW